MIGQRAEEARDAVDEFLDRAVMATASRVRIVHGHGMGMLSKVIQELLGSHPHVARFYPAPSRRVERGYHRGTAGLGEPMNRLARRFLFIAWRSPPTLAIGTVGFTLIEHYPPSTPST